MCEQKQQYKYWPAIFGPIFFTRRYINITYEYQFNMIEHYVSGWSCISVVFYIIWNYPSEEWTSEKICLPSLYIKRSQHILWKYSFPVLIMMFKKCNSLVIYLSHWCARIIQMSYGSQLSILVHICHPTCRQRYLGDIFTKYTRIYNKWKRKNSVLAITMNT